MLRIAVPVAGCLCLLLPSLNDMGSSVVRAPQASSLVADMLSSGRVPCRA